MDPTFQARLPRTVHAVHAGARRARCQLARAVRAPPASLRARAPVVRARCQLAVQRFGAQKLKQSHGVLVVCAAHSRIEGGFCHGGPEPKPPFSAVGPPRRHSQTCFNSFFFRSALFFRSLSIGLLQIPVKFIHFTFTSSFAGCRPGLRREHNLRNSQNFLFRGIFSSASAPSVGRLSVSWYRRL